MKFAGTVFLMKDAATVSCSNIAGSNSAGSNIAGTVFFQDIIFLHWKHNRGYKNLGRILETIAGADGVVRSAIVQTRDGVFNRALIKLFPVLLTEKDILLEENSANDVTAEL